MVIRQSSDNLRTTCKLIGKSSEDLRQFDCLSEGIFGSSIVCRRCSSDFGCSRIIFGEYSDFGQSSGTL